MDQATGNPALLPERLIVSAIVGTWLLWLVGGLYIAGPALGWILALILFWRAYASPAGHRPTLPFAAIFWGLAMLAMLMILWAGHAANGLGTGQTIKSSIGWAKGWALMALFVIAGAGLNVRADTLYRAVCRLGRITLLLLPLFLLAPWLGLPQILYVSPLKILGGAGDEYFSVVLYTLEPGTGAPRWQFFAPWSPAAGMIAIVHFLCAIEEKDWRWKLTGVTSSVATILLSQSRLALIAMVVIWPISWAITNFRRPVLSVSGAMVAMITGWMGPSLIQFAQQMQSDFAGARADSSRVRDTLGRIAIERWENEAYWVGHGIVENGPHLVEYMPIGSHHSWYGLLFVKGLAGLLALLLPLLLSMIAITIYGNPDTRRVGLSMLFVLIMYSFGENLEVLAYLYWPALLIIGMALRKMPRAAAPDLPRSLLQISSAIR
jgi:hypothetical protein